MEGRQADDRVLPASHFPIFCHSNICCSSNRAFPLSFSFPLQWRKSPSNRPSPSPIRACADVKQIWTTSIRGNYHKFRLRRRRWRTGMVKE